MSADVDPRPPWLRDIDDSLRPYQRQVRQFIIDHPYAGVFLTIGGGKTRTTLSALAHLRPPGHILVVAPGAVARTTWPTEVVDLSIPMTVISLDMTGPRTGRGGKTLKSRRMTPAERTERFDSIATTPPAMWTISDTMFTKLVEHFSANDYADWPFWTVVVDESQSLKDPSTNLFKSMWAVRPRIGRLILLSGTPASEGTDEIWSQIYLLDMGAALGDQDAFLNRWFTPAQMISGKVVKWKISDDNRADIYQRIRHVAISAENTSLELPELTNVNHVVELTEQEKAHYDAFKKNAVFSVVMEATEKKVAEDMAQLAEQGIDITLTTPVNEESFIREVIAANRAVLRSKCLEFAAGAIYLDIEQDDPAFAEATEITERPTTIVHNHKISKLIDIINDTDSPVLVAHRFRSDRDRLLHWLPRHGHDAIAFDGSPEMLERWNNGEIPVLLIHPASAGHGINFQYGGHTLVWFNLPDSAQQWQQTNGRLHRIGQTEPVTIHTIVTAGTYDETLPAMLDTKRSHQMSMLAALRRHVRDDAIEALSAIRATAAT